MSWRIKTTAQQMETYQGGNAKANVQKQKDQKAKAPRETGQLLGASTTGRMSSLDLALGRRRLAHSRCRRAHTEATSCPIPEVGIRAPTPAHLRRSEAAALCFWPRDCSRHRAPW